MPYTKTNWVAGDIVTSAKLNKIENQLENLSNNPFSSILVPWKTTTAINEDFTASNNDGVAVISARLLEFEGISEEYFKPAILKTLNIQITKDSQTWNASLSEPISIYMSGQSGGMLNGLNSNDGASFNGGFGEGYHILDLYIYTSAISPGDLIHISIPSTTLYMPNEEIISDLALALNSYWD